MGFGASKPDPDFPPITPILVPRTLKGYPHPKPPQTKKNDIINWEKFASIDARSKSITVSDQTRYDELLEALTHGLVSEVEKVRAIFTWLGTQRIYQSFYPGVDDPTTPKGYMKLIKKQLGSYTEFFTLLCRAADLPCVIVRGRCKSSKYEPGDHINPCMSSTWPAVFVDDNWRIVHPYWAFPDVTEQDRHCHNCSSLDDNSTGDTSDNNNVEYAVEEFFFLPDPEEFRYFCWPEKSEWQLSKYPWTFHDFCQAPYFHSPYFTSGLKLASKQKCTLSSRSGLCTIRFEHKPSRNIKVSYIMFAKQNYSDSNMNNARLEMYVCKESGKNDVKLHVRLPARGVYKIIIYGGLSHVLQPLVDFRLECNEDDYYRHPYPLRSSIGLGLGQRALGCGLQANSHLCGIVPLRYGTEAFDFDHACPEKCEAVLRHHSLPDTALRACVTKLVGQQHVQFLVDIPDVDEEADEFVLQVYVEVSQNTNTLINVLNYLLTSCPQPFGIEYREKKDKAVEVKLDRLNEDEETTALEHVKSLTLQQSKQNGSISTMGDFKLAWNIKSLAWTEKVGGLKKDLSDAMKDRSREGLEKNFSELLCLGQDVSCFKQELSTLVVLYEEQIAEKRSANDLDNLMNLIAESSQSVMSDRLKESTAVVTAKDFLGRQHRVRQYGAVIQTLTRQTVCSIANGGSPNTIFLDVTRATFLILGEDETSLQKWSNIQNLLMMSGSQSIVSRIGRFNVDTLGPKVSRKVRILLDQYTIDDVKASSSGLAAFYLWALGVVKTT